MNAPYAQMARDLLPGWEISLAFVKPATAKALNARLRGKTYVPNVLSYTVGKRHGEILICKEVAKEDAPKFGLSARDFLTLLFIHALLHLKGARHGSTMERREHALLSYYVSTHRNRSRRRHLAGQSRRRRRGRR